jgi:hypothetical protein
LTAAAVRKEVTSYGTFLSTLCHMDGREYQAIEQNPEKPSRWGELAREGHQVVQFKNGESNRFVAVAVDGEVTIYGGRERDAKTRQ